VRESSNNGKTNSGISDSKRVAVYAGEQAHKGRQEGEAGPAAAVQQADQHSGSTHLEEQEGPVGQPQTENQPQGKHANTRPTPDARTRMPTAGPIATGREGATQTSTHPTKHPGVC
jgi:hypothetical protein